MPGFQSSPALQNYQSFQSGPPPEMPVPKKARKKKRFPIWARIAVAMLALLVIVGGSGLTYYEIEIAPSLNSITGHQAIHHYSASTGARDDGGSTQDTQTNGAILSGGRINILLLGSDDDGKGNSIQTGIPLAQTDIVVTIDPQTNYVAMVSFPRDLQVSVPGFSPTKLDLAFSDGWTGKDVPTRVASAAGMTIDTLQYNFGIHIDYYAWVGLDGFVKVIDTAGGVDIDAIHPMVDDNYPDDGKGSNNPYGYMRLYIAPGPQHMDGAQALDYVRTRHSDLVGDFGRSARQQQMLTQLKAKLEKPGIIDQAPQLLQDLNGFLETNMQLSDIIKIANYARTVDLNKIERITLGPPYATASLTNSNYLPNCGAIIPVISRVFALGNKANCIPQTASAASSTSLASAAPSPSATAATLNTTSLAANPTGNNGWQSLSQAALLGEMSLKGGNGDWPAVHSMLDLMLMTAFGSFDAMTT